MITQLIASSGCLPSDSLFSTGSRNAAVLPDYEGADGYVSAEYVTVDFQIDSGETLEEIKAREAAEREAKRHVNYGEYTTDADTTQLLAALIQCEAAEVRRAGNRHRAADDGDDDILQITYGVHHRHHAVGHAAGACGVFRPDAVAAAQLRLALLLMAKDLDDLLKTDINGG